MMRKMARRPRLWCKWQPSQNRKMLKSL
jgi:hypothetical protein